MRHIIPENSGAGVRDKPLCPNPIDAARLEEKNDVPTRQGRA
jgi:hypothetical protein